MNVNITGRHITLNDQNRQHRTHPISPDGLDGHKNIFGSKRIEQHERFSLLLQGRNISKILKQFTPYKPLGIVFVYD